MTRETKIGLLVGLAFIIVIGILLSDQMKTTSEPPQAQLGGAGSNVRESVTAPAGSGPAVSLSGQPADAPRVQVPTRRDLDQPAPPPVGEVQIGPGPTALSVDRQSARPGSQQAAPPERRRVAQEPTGAAGQPTNTEIADNLLPADGPPVVPTQTPGPRSNRDGRPGRPVHELVRGNPDDLVEVDGNVRQASDSKPVTDASKQPGPGNTAAPRHYVAQTGDSVTRLAAKYLGSASKANIDLIIKANPSLQTEGNMMIVGRTYVIPNAGTTPPAALPAGNTVAGKPAAPSESKSTVWYTVKDNDNLWKIAEQQLGSGNSWTAIRDANRDALKGGETVHKNMRLRMPPKPSVATSAD